MSKGNTCVELMTVGSQWTEIPNALKLVEPRTVTETFRWPDESVVIDGIVWGQIGPSAPGTIHTLPTYGGAKGGNSGASGVELGLYERTVPKVLVTNRIIIRAMNLIDQLLPQDFSIARVQ